ncbi:hypothetical protein ACI8AA_17415 [Geodermatophilus sp. SYSU D01180]
MPEPPPDLLRGPFRGSEALRRGLLTRGQLRTSAWRRLRPDVYLAADRPVTHLTQADAVALVAPPEAVFGGRTAAVRHGARHLAGPDDPVEVVLPPGVRWHPTSGVLVRSASLAGDVVTDGRWCWTGRTRTALDLVRRGSLDDAVVLLDQLVRADVADLAAVRAAAASLPRCRGSAQARTAAALADGLAESPQETRVRLLLGRSGVPAPVAQHVVRHRSRFVARVDFAWPDRRLALEYDRAWHGDPGQFARDRDRLNRLLAAGWRVVFVTARDLHHPEELVFRVAAVLVA